jgi:hypothetical protein
MKKPRTMQEGDMTSGNLAATRREIVVGGLGAAGGLLLAASGLDAAPRPGGTPHPDDAWLDRLPGRERHLFDASEALEGRMLSLIRHYHDTYRDVFGLRDGEVATVGTLYGGTTCYGLDDSMWRKYRLGGTEATGENPWRVAPVIGGNRAPTASIEALQQRGTAFLLCRAALSTRAGQVADREGLPRPQVLSDMEAHLLPGVVLVASVIVAIQRAQRHGVSYYRVT